ncbi:MAG: DUF485 domain-containing protein [Candidatus Delongbacteria bacterium]
MLHKPAAPTGKDPSSAFKARLGVWMFAVYALIYVGFVAINIADPLAMEHTVFAGLNLAVVYGMGLILVALVLALVYDRVCSVRERLLASKEGRN